MSEEAIIILIRNPILGRVKTRLAADLGDAKALDVYLQLLNYTRSVVLKVDCSRLLFYSEYIEKDDNWDPTKFRKYLQEGNDFGEKMCNAFRIALKKHKKTVIIGSDCFELTDNILRMAFKRLNSHDVVLGPATDGGYYLLGLKRIYPQLFKNKKWSTSTVLTNTLDDVKNLDLNVYLLPLLSDIDDVNDLKEHPTLYEEIELDLNKL